MTKSSDVHDFGYSAPLVPIDLTAASDRILGRVALLPLARKARVTLLHVVPSGLPPAAQRAAERDAHKALAEEARHLSRLVDGRASVVPIVATGAAASEIAARGTETNADIIVMGRAGGRALRDHFLGSTAERVIRRARLPVLVVRLRPRAPYRRPALALDFDDAASAAIGQLFAMIPAPRPPVTVLHAYEPPYRGQLYPSVPEPDLEAYREHYRREAVHELADVIAGALSNKKLQTSNVPVWRTHVQLGWPKPIIAKAVKKADTDLLILGSHGRSGLAYVILGTVAGEILREVGCDVLVVPPRPRHAKAAHHEAHARSDGGSRVHARPASVLFLR